MTPLMLSADEWEFYETWDRQLTPRCPPDGTGWLLVQWHPTGTKSYMLWSRPKSKAEVKP